MVGREFGCFGLNGVSPLKIIVAEECVKLIRKLRDLLMDCQVLVSGTLVTVSGGLRLVDGGMGLVVGVVLVVGVG